MMPKLALAVNTLPPFFQLQRGIYQHNEGVDVQLAVAVRTSVARPRVCNQDAKTPKRFAILLMFS